MARRMFRYSVAIAHGPQVFELCGNPVRVEVANGAPDFVDFWAEGDDDPAVPRARRTFQVFGTGHALPAGARWQGTTARTPQGLVWHLYEIPGSSPA